MYPFEQEEPNPDINVEMGWASKDPEEIIDKLDSSYKGLSSKEAKDRLKKYGPNRVDRTKRFIFLKYILKQFQNPIVSILLISGVFVYMIGQQADAYIIFATLLINLTIGLVQEKKVSKAFELLNQAQKTKARTLRDGKEIEVLTEELVIGDVVRLRAGMNVPADIRLFNTENFSVNESSLTGEWSPVEKDTTTLLNEKPLTGQINMVWKETTTVSGVATGIVVATGKNTVVGSLAKYLESDESHTPLQAQVEKIARLIMTLILITVVCIVIIGVLKNIGWFDVILTSTAIAIAGIPSGLPAAITVVLVLGMQQILKNKGLVRNMVAAETLGSTTWILTDKTGTLTTGKMHLKDLIFLNNRESVDGDLSPIGKQSILGAFMATDSEIINTQSEIQDEEMSSKKNHAVGTPIEQAITNITQKLFPNQTRDDRIAYLSFDTRRRYSSALVKNEKKGFDYFSFGAPEKFIDIATEVYEDGAITKLTEDKRKRLRDILDREGEKGRRVLAITMQSNNKKNYEDDIREIKNNDLSCMYVENQNLAFLCFLSIEDSIRKDVPNSIRFIQDANVNTTMVTGDNPETALTVAKQVGIIKTSDVDTVLLGKDLKKLNDEDLYTKAQFVRVFARMLPDQKLRLLRVLMERGEVVAMTGDGINDAPALHSASIGIVVASGTDVAKEASDLVLLKNSFTTITNAILEGRKIITNLKKILLYLLSTSFSEAILVAGALLITSSLPITPVQILWANIVEEAFIAFAFALEKGDPDIALRDPRSERTNTIVSKGVKKATVILAFTTGSFLILTYLFLRSVFDLSDEQLQTLMFLLVSIDSIFLALSLKRLTRGIWKSNFLDNIWLLGAMVISLLLVILAFITPFLSNILSIVEVPKETLFVIPFSAVFHLIVIESVKKFVFGRENTKKQKSTYTSTV